MPFLFVLSGIDTQNNVHRYPGLQGTTEEIMRWFFDHGLRFDETDAIFRDQSSIDMTETFETDNDAFPKLQSHYRHIFNLLPREFNRFGRDIYTHIEINRQMIMGGGKRKSRRNRRNRKSRRNRA